MVSAAAEAKRPGRLWIRARCQVVIAVPSGVAQLLVVKPLPHYAIVNRSSSSRTEAA